MPDVRRPITLPHLVRALVAAAAILVGIAACDRPPLAPPSPQLDADAGRGSWIVDDPPEMLPASTTTLRQGLGRAWKVDLDHDLRSTVSLPSGAPWTARVASREGNRLSFGYGLPPDAGGAVAFRVVAGGRAVFDDVVGPDRAGRWLEGDVPLPAARSLRVRLEVEATGGADDVGLWANPTVVAAEPSRGPNVLLVSVDTLRADRLGLAGYHRTTSPSLDDWAARRATVFETVIAASPWTLPSHTTMLTGLDALTHGVNHDLGGVDVGLGVAPNAALDTLAERFRRAGWRTLAVTGGAYLDPKYGLAQGFDRYLSWPDRGRSAEELPRGVDQTLEWLEQRRGPTFVFLHTYDVHDPYRARRPWFRRFAPPGVAAPPSRLFLSSPPNDPRDGFRQHNRLELRPRGGEPVPLPADDLALADVMYDSGVAGMDAEIGRLLRGLERLGIADDTLVVVTSDHGESLGEGGRFGHVDLADETLRVPLLVSAPGGEGWGRRVARQVRQADLAPTILDLAGLGVPPGLEGESLRGDLRREVEPPGSDAWSYSAAANRGLALTVDRRFRYTFDNNAWRPDPAGRGSLEPTGAAPPPGEAELAALEAALHERLVDYVRGTARDLRLDVRHDGPGVLEATLTGGMIRPVGTKTVDLGCACVRWLEMGRAALEVPPGERFTLQFEKVLGPRLRVEARVRGGRDPEPVARNFAVDRLTGTTGLDLGPEGWVRVDHDDPTDPSPAGGTGFRLRWHGEAAIRTESPAADDPALQRQLRALGYVD